MKIALVNTQAPFIRGGAEYLVESLGLKLGEFGHQVEIINIPFKWYPFNNIPHQIIANRLLRLDIIEPDLIICHKFPSYYIPYPEKKIWLFHQFRQAYDLWGTSYQEFPDTLEANRVRDMIVRADNAYLPEAKAIFTNSKIVANRLKNFNQIYADDVLYPPLYNPDLYSSGETGDYFFYPSRMTPGKRQSIAIEAMKHVRSNFTLILAGSPDSPQYNQILRKMINRLGLTNKVKILDWVSENEKARYMSDCLAVLYLPYDEDSYGFVTLEAFHSHKPVIVFKDSGGTDEVMEHEINGLILEPSPKALADGMEKLWAQRKKVKEMGENAFETIQKHNISWENVIERLLK